MVAKSLKESGSYEDITRVQWHWERQTKHLDMVKLEILETNGPDNKKQKIENLET